LDGETDYSRSISNPETTSVHSAATASPAATRSAATRRTVVRSASNSTYGNSTPMLPTLNRPSPRMVTGGRIRLRPVPASRPVRATVPSALPPRWARRPCRPPATPASRTRMQPPRTKFGRSDPNPSFRQCPGVARDGVDDLMGADVDGASQSFGTRWLRSSRNVCATTGRSRKREVGAPRLRYMAFYASVKRRVSETSRLEWMEGCYDSPARVARIHHSRSAAGRIEVVIIVTWD
jgi:hypothetical protein